MTTKELARFLEGWPYSSPSWFDVGRYTAEVEDPAVQTICCHLALMRAPAPDFGRTEDGFILRWYRPGVIVTVRIEDDSAAVEIAREAGGGSTEVLEWQ